MGLSADSLSPGVLRCMSDEDRARYGLPRRPATVAVVDGASLEVAGSGKAARRQRPEDALQRQVMAWWALRWRSLGAPDERVLMHIPNGSHKSPAQRGLFKALGLRPGVSDLFLAMPGLGVPFSLTEGHTCGLWIELKAGSRGQVSEAQESFQRAMEAVGYAAVICRSYPEAVGAIERHLNGHPRGHVTTKSNE